MSTPQRIVVGGGLAGAKTVEELRTQGYAGELTLVHREAHLPYERPPLSKEYLAGERSADRLLLLSARPARLIGEERLAVPRARRDRAFVEATRAALAARYPGVVAG